VQYAGDLPGERWGFGGQLGSYELWDPKSGNLIAELDSEAEALTAIRWPRWSKIPPLRKGLLPLRCNGDSSTAIARGSRLASLTT
jgi:hypothetical protein